MSLDGKYKYIEEKLAKSNIKLFHYISAEELELLDLLDVDRVMVEPVEFSKYQQIGDFLVELATIPKMVGKIIKSTVDNLEVGDEILYTNNYIAFRYFIYIDIEGEEKIYFSIPNEDIIMKKAF